MEHNMQLCRLAFSNYPVADRRNEYTASLSAINSHSSYIIFALYRLLRYHTI